MTDTEAKAHIFTGQPGGGVLKVDLNIIPTIGPTLLIDPLAPIPPKTRNARKWEPTAREQAILNIPREKELKDYCQMLDDSGVPFPEKWQRSSRPASHLEAYENVRIQRCMRSERRNIWNRFLERD
jgi:hypothetical protein